LKIISRLISLALIFLSVQTPASRIYTPKGTPQIFADIRGGSPEGRRVKWEWGRRNGDFRFFRLLYLPNFHITGRNYYLHVYPLSGF